MEVPAPGCEILARMTPANTVVAAILLAVFAAVAGAWFAARHSAPAQPTSAQVLTTPRSVPAVPGVDHAGQAFSRADLEGRWSVVFFGFTHCPDVCPATLHVLAGARKLLDDVPAQDLPQVLMISVDPGRDTPERLAEYVPFFHPEFRGLRVADEHLPELTRGFGATYGYAPLGEDSYTVDHTTTLFLVDPQARVAAVLPGPHTAEGVATDLYRIIMLENAR